MADVLSPEPICSSPGGQARAVKFSSATYFLLAAIGALFVAIFVPLMVPVERAWRNDSNYSHGYLVPILCLWLFHRSWLWAGPPRTGEPRFALIALLPGVGLLLAATVVPWPLLTFVAFVLILRGIAVALGGRSWAGFFWAPIVYAIFMFPVPVTWTSYAALWLQDIVSRLSAGVLELFVPCLRTGTVIRILGVPQPLHVGEQCSGLRQLMGFLAFSVLLGFLLNRPAWHRVALVVMTVPIAILANVVRVLLMSFGAIRFGTHWMNGWLHDAPAGFTIPVGFVLLFSLDYLLRRVYPSTEVEVKTEAKTSAGSLALPLRSVALFLGLALILQWGLRAHLSEAGADSFPGLNAALATVPYDLETGQNHWSGRDRPELADLREKLPYAADEILLRDYILLGNGSGVQVYAVYSRLGEDRRHHPEICVREVTGAPEDLKRRTLIPLDANGQRQVQRFVFLTGLASRMTVYYWHYTLMPESTRNTYLQSLHQRLGHPAPSVTVQVWTNLAPTDAVPEPLELKRIEEIFLPALDAALSRGVLPRSAMIGATRLPIALLRE